MSYVVVGGGVSGLAAAFYLKSLVPSAKRVVLLESSHRLGGWIETTRCDDGILFEHGPRTIRPAGPQGANTLHLVEALGLSDSIIPISRSHPAALNRYVMVDKKLHKLPSSLSSLFKPLDPFKQPLILAGLKDLLTPAKMAKDDSIFSFVERRFGTRLAQYAVDPMVRGICAGNARDISAASFVTKDLFKLEQDHGGVIRGVLANQIKKWRSNDSEEDDSSLSPLVRRAREEKWSVWSLRGGLGTLVSNLTRQLQDMGVEILLNQNVISLSKSKGGISIQTSNGGELSGFNHAILSSPAFKSSQILSQSYPLTSKLLSEIPFVTVAVVNIEFDRKVTPIEAFGFLVPSDQPSRILGAIFDTCSFPQSNKDIFTVMMGGYWFNQLFGTNPDSSDIQALAVQELCDALKITDQPSRILTKIQTNCIAQYVVGHADRVAQARSGLVGEPISLVGSSYDGVGVNDAIMSSKRAVEII